MHRLGAADDLEGLRVVDGHVSVGNDPGDSVPSECRVNVEHDP